VAQGQGQTLREFGLFGGDASEAPNSGYLVNYVVHPRLDLRPGETLSRRVRLSFRSSEAKGEHEWLNVPDHWLGGSPVTAIDGVGKKFEEALKAARVRTVAELARMEPTQGGRRSLPVTKLVELRAKARLALRAVADVAPMPALKNRSIIDILTVPPAALARDAEVPASAAQRLREQLGALQLALDASTLRRLTLERLQSRT
jgi:hypothetical protein